MNFFYYFIMFFFYFFFFKPGIKQKKYLFVLILGQKDPVFCFDKESCFSTSVENFQIYLEPHTFSALEKSKKKINGMFFVNHFNTDAMNLNLMTGEMFDNASLEEKSLYKQIQVIKCNQIFVIFEDKFFCITDPKLKEEFNNFYKKPCQEIIINEQNLVTDCIKEKKPLRNLADFPEDNSFLIEDIKFFGPEIDHNSITAMSNLLQKNEIVITQVPMKPQSLSQTNPSSEKSDFFRIGDQLHRHIDKNREEAEIKNINKETQINDSKNNNALVTKEDLIEEANRLHTNLTSDKNEFFGNLYQLNKNLFESGDRSSRRGLNTENDNTQIITKDSATINQTPRMQFTGSLPTNQASGNVPFQIILDTTILNIKPENITSSTLEYSPMISTIIKSSLNKTIVTPAPTTYLSLTTIPKRTNQSTLAPTPTKSITLQKSTQVETLTKKSSITTRFSSQSSTPLSEYRVTTVPNTTGSTKQQFSTGNQSSQQTKQTTIVSSQSPTTTDKKLTETTNTTTQVPVTLSSITSSTKTMSPTEVSTTSLLTTSPPLQTNSPFQNDIDPNVTVGQTNTPNSTDTPPITTPQSSQETKQTTIASTPVPIKSTILFSETNIQTNNLFTQDPNTSISITVNPTTSLQPLPFLGFFDPSSVTEPANTVALIVPQFIDQKVNKIIVPSTQRLIRTTDKKPTQTNIATEIPTTTNTKIPTTLTTISTTTISPTTRLVPDTGPAFQISFDPKATTIQTTKPVPTDTEPSISPQNSQQTNQTTVASTQAPITTKKTPITTTPRQTPTTSMPTQTPTTLTTTSTTTMSPTTRLVPDTGPAFQLIIQTTPPTTVTTTPTPTEQTTTTPTQIPTSQQTTETTPSPTTIGSTTPSPTTQVTPKPTVSSTKQKSTESSTKKTFFLFKPKKTTLPPSKTNVTTNNSTNNFVSQYQSGCTMVNVEQKNTPTSICPVDKPFCPNNMMVFAQDQLVACTKSNLLQIPNDFLNLEQCEPAHVLITTSEGLFCANINVLFGSEQTNNIIYDDMVFSDSDKEMLSAFFGLQNILGPDQAMKAWDAIKSVQNIYTSEFDPNQLLRGCNLNGGSISPVCQSGYMCENSFVIPDGENARFFCFSDCLLNGTSCPQKIKYIDDINTMSLKDMLYIQAFSFPGSSISTYDQTNNLFLSCEEIFINKGLVSCTNAKTISPLFFYFFSANCFILIVKFLSFILKTFNFKNLCNTATLYMIQKKKFAQVLNQNNPTCFEAFLKKKTLEKPKTFDSLTEDEFFLQSCLRELQNLKPEKFQLENQNLNQEENIEPNLSQKEIIKKITRTGKFILSKYDNNSVIFSLFLEKLGPNIYMFLYFVFLIANGVETWKSFPFSTPEKSEFYHAAMNIFLICSIVLWAFQQNNFYSYVLIVLNIAYNGFLIYFF